MDNWTNNWSRWWEVFYLMKKNLSQKQVNLIAWIKQKWKTKSGKKSSLTGERYLPEKAIKTLKKSDYKFTSKLKIKALKKGKQQTTI